MVGVFPKNKTYNIYFQDYNSEDKYYICTTTSDSQGKINFDESGLKGKTGWLLINMLDAPYTPNFSLPYSDNTIPVVNWVKICKEGQNLLLNKSTEIMCGVLGNKTVLKTLPQGLSKIDNVLFQDPLPGIAKFGYIKDTDLRLIINSKVTCQN